VSSQGHERHESITAAIYLIKFYCTWSNLTVLGYFLINSIVFDWISWNLFVFSLYFHCNRLHLIEIDCIWLKMIERSIVFDWNWLYLIENDWLIDRLYLIENDWLIDRLYLIGNDWLIENRDNFRKTFTNFRKNFRISPQISTEIFRKFVKVARPCKTCVRARSNCT
jgi:hypothetical protein